MSALAVLADALTLAATVVPTAPATESPAPFAPAPPAGLDPTRVTPGALGFAVMLVLGIATYLLIRSMNGHLRNIPQEPDLRIPPGPPREPGNRDSRPPDGTDPGTPEPRSAPSRPR